MFIIGIDPGLTGGIAIIPLYAFEQTQVYAAEHFPMTELASLLSEMRAGTGDYEADTQAEVFLEEPSLNPYLPGNKCPRCKKGPMRNSQSFAKLGRSLGQFEGVCTAHGYIPTLVFSTKWQNFLECRTKGNKNVTKTLATKIFPFLSRTLKGSGEQKSTVTHAVADALLIALYGYLQYANPKYLTSSLRANLPPKIIANLKAKDNDRRIGSTVPRITPGSDRSTQEVRPPRRTPPSKSGR